MHMQIHFITIVGGSHQVEIFCGGLTVDDESLEKEAKEKHHHPQHRNVDGEGNEADS